MANKMYEVLKTYTVLPPQVLSGASVTYNSNAIGGTGPFSNPTNVGYIDGTGYRKALIRIPFGQITGPGQGTVNVVSAPLGTVGATGGAVGATGLNGSSVTFTTADDNTTKTIEVDLDKIPGAQFWVKVDHPSTLISNISAEVILGEPDKAPAVSSVDAEFRG